MTRKSPNKGFFKLTDAQIHAAAKKFQHRGDFSKHGKGAYQSAWARGILDSVCAHMTRKVKWTDELLKVEADKYDTKADFRDHSHAAYVTAHKRGLLPTIGKHLR